ncbi:MAG: ABC transporter permease [Chloroflexota bacterium]|nr:MAG: ABC transporter permease [Chloroflexota bacterium]
MNRLRISAPLVALLLAILLFFVGGLIRPGFTSYAQAINILRVSAFLGIVAAGQTLVIISGGEGIDLSVGAVVTLGAILVFRIANGQNELVLPALMAALATGALIGLVNGLGIAYVRIPPLVMTLGMTGLVQGLILIVTRGQMIGQSTPLMTRFISGPLFLGIPGMVFVWLLLGGLMWLILERTAYGKQVFAIGVNRDTARLSGVRVSRVVVLTYAISGLLAALGGFVLLGYTQKVFLRLGEPYTLPSVAAVVVGGTLLSGGMGSYWGTMAGALVLTLITSLLTTLQMPESTRLIVYGLTLLILLAIYGRQKGLRL